MSMLAKGTDCVNIIIINEEDKILVLHSMIVGNANSFAKSNYAPLDAR